MPRKLIQLKIKEWEDVGTYNDFCQLTCGKGLENLSIMLHIEGAIISAYGTAPDLQKYSDRLKKIPVRHEFIYQE